MNKKVNAICTRQPERYKFDIQNVITTFWWLYFFDIFGHTSTSTIACTYIMWCVTMWRAIGCGGRATNTYIIYTHSHIYMYMCVCVLNGCVCIYVNAYFTQYTRSAGCVESSIEITRIFHFVGYRVYERFFFRYFISFLFIFFTLLIGNRSHDDIPNASIEKYTLGC